jgi:hypothetical protein
LAYAIHIEREPPITLPEWRAAVEQTSGVRMADSELDIVNPTSREVIQLGGAGVDAEVCLPNRESWARVFYWKASGHISFAAPNDFDAPDSIIRRLANELARALGARLVGDEGEVYS